MDDDKASTVETVTEPDATMRIPAGLVCIGCGYGMDGLRRADVCPECATPVEWSLGADLRRADRTWLVRLCRGAAVTHWAFIAFALLIVIGGAGLPLAVGWLGWQAPSEEAVFFPIAAVFLLAANAWLIGWRLVATPDPDRPDGESRRQRAGAFIRGVFLVAVVAQAGFIAGWLVSAVALMARGASAGAIAAGVASTMILGAIVVTLCAVLVYYASLSLTRRLAVRIPAPRLARWAGRVRWHFPVAIAVLLLAMFLLGVLIPTRTSALFLAGAVILVAIWWMAAHILIYSGLRGGLRETVRWALHDRVASEGSGSAA